LKYLGLPLGASFKLKTIWDGVVEEIERRLVSWKKILGWSPNSNQEFVYILPTYFLSLYPLPAGIAIRLERLQKNFFYGGME
jgi:hypothetical protein